MAPLAVDAKISFIPVKPTKSARRLEINGQLHLPGLPLPWSTTAGAATKSVGNVMIDTKGPLRPDTLISGSTNFWPGWQPGAVLRRRAARSASRRAATTPAARQHCTGGVTACYPSACP